MRVNESLTLKKMQRTKSDNQKKNSRKIDNDKTSK